MSTLDQLKQDAFAQLRHFKRGSPHNDARIENLAQICEQIYAEHGFAAMQEVYHGAKKEFSWMGPENPYAILDRAWEGIGGWLP